jgi:hypothetical protein
MKSSERAREASGPLYSVVVLKSWSGGEGGARSELGSCLLVEGRRAQTGLAFTCMQTGDRAMWRSSYGIGVVGADRLAAGRLRYHFNSVLSALLAH